MKSCRVNKLDIGGDAPPRIMGVINCSGESFYQASYIPIDKVHETAVAMVEQGADMIDIGARSTAPNTQPISGREEAERVDAALKELDGSGITLSVDTMHPGVLDICLKHEIHAANDISGFVSPAYAKKVADAGLPTFVMAANQNPGDPIGVDATLASLEGVIKRCEASGVKEYVLDPGIGIWTPHRSVADDWELCRQFETFQRFDHPLLAAVSRKTFIGMLLNREPEDRLPGTLAVTMTLLEKGASIVRTHDVAATRDIIRVYEQMVKRA
ncbi:dihydropteroate synthase [Methanoregula boonei 6A8]|uniref:dihydropteroate synthase n=1 Tax=Methanoregula boonei (strain DSM 21154 / JCM 14090 / 6A8) TaxID=456442 RepID=A7IAE2_METB6|nr:dihydropteroate synthase [Methanoregula boonei]ABS56703.1 dihydropteroate synthase [Methanoregula boonei 6A8]